MVTFYPRLGKSALSWTRPAELDSAGRCELVGGSIPPVYSPPVWAQKEDGEAGEEKESHLISPKLREHRRRCLTEAEEGVDAEKREEGGCHWHEGADGMFYAIQLFPSADLTVTRLGEKPPDEFAHEDHHHDGAEQLTDCEQAHRVLLDSMSLGSTDFDGIVALKVLFRKV